jgi:hypothetical protein
MIFSRATQQRGQRDHPQWPECSGQKPHALGVDGKSLTELSGARLFNPISHRLHHGAESNLHSSVKNVDKSLHGFYA